MAKKNNEKLFIGWCDDGAVDGMFAESLVNTVIKLKSVLPIIGFARAQGIQIAKQRQSMVNAWLDSDVDWMLWVDSDVAITPEIVLGLWETAHKNNLKLLSGVYYTFWVPEATPVPVPVPTVFAFTENGSQPIHPLPENQVIQADYIGLGLVLIHRSVVETLKEKFTDGVFFAEYHGPNGKFTSEDAQFCAKLNEAGIPVLVHTGIIAQHMKRISVDKQYYDLYWSKQLEQQTGK